MILSDPDSPEVAIWQLVESCGYTADLPAWSEITGDAGSAGGVAAVLDLGCGIGRVARHLAAEGRVVVGVEVDPHLAADLNRLSADERVSAVTGSATDLASLDLGQDRFEAIIAPQQLLHIVGGKLSRGALLEGVRQRLSPDGTAVFAISEWIPEDSRQVDVLPDVREIGEWVYASRPVAVEDDGDSLTVIRLRQVVAPDGSLQESHDRITLDRMDRHMLNDELAEAGLAVERTIEIPETDRHIATVIVVARHKAGNP